MMAGEVPAAGFSEQAAINSINITPSPKARLLLFSSISPSQNSSPNVSPRSSQSISQNLFTDDDDSRVLKRVKRSTSLPCGNDEKRVDEFFSSVINDLKQANSQIMPRPSFVLVCHMTQTIFSFLKAIKTIGDIALVIPKGYQRESAKKIIQRLKVQELISDKNFIDPITISGGEDEIKQMIKKDGIAIIRKYVNDNRFVIIDIGGYFAKTFEDMILSEETNDLRDKFIGIVEDTRNGHKKYNESIRRLKASLQFNLKPNQANALGRLYSVADCELKSTEDYNVGKSIVEASETIMMTDAHVTLERMDIVGVVGFGNIGKSIARHLQQKNLRRIIVYDMDPLKQMEASSLGFQVVDRSHLIANSELIFSATGNKCLKSDDLTCMKDNVFIASCTSRDDEFDISFCKFVSKNVAREDRESEHGDILKLKLFDKNINLLDKGNAVNFVYGAVNGPYIYSVQAGLIVSSTILLYKQDTIVNNDGSLLSMEIKSLPKTTMEYIATKWLRIFDNCQSNPDTALNKGIFDPTGTTDKKYIDIADYFEKNQYSQLKNERLKNIFEAVKKTVTNKNDSFESIEDVLKNIMIFLDKGMFAILMSYAVEMLINSYAEWGQAVHKNHFLIEIKLLLLKATALLYLNVNEYVSQMEQEDLQTNLAKVNAKIYLYDLNSCSEDEKIGLLKFLKFFLNTINFFSQKGVEFKIGLDELKKATDDLDDFSDRRRKATPRIAKE